MNPARAPWRGSLPLLLSLLCTACFSAREVSSLGTYDRPDAGRSDDDDLVVEPAPPSTAGPRPLPEPEDASRPPARDAGLDARDADVLRCNASGCIGTLPGIEEERVCFDVRAHAADSESAYAYQPGPENPQDFVTFTMRTPDPGLRTIREIAPLIDNSAVVHHMRLYKHRGALPPGVAVGKAPASEMTFLYAWQPGERILFTFEDSAGIPIANSDLLTLEIHYVTTTRPGSTRVANGRDASGMRICSIREAVRLPLSFVRLGAPAESGPGERLCTPQLSEPVQLIGVFPTPERETVISPKMFVQRRSGERETFFSEPLANSGEQFAAFYLPAPVLYPGDSFGWDCTYGDGASGPYEPCTLQLLHTPAGAIWDACREGPGAVVEDPVLR